WSTCVVSSDLQWSSFSWAAPISSVTVPKVTDEMVAAQLNELRGQRAPWLPVTREKPKPRDLVQVTIATREGAQVKDPQPYQLVLGEGRAIPELEQRIMGLLPGATIDTIV